MNKYEKLIEYIVNDEQDKARALFHDIVVEKSRGIYESMMDDEGQEHPGGDQVGGMMDEISSDEHGMHEEDDEMGMDGDEEFGTDDEMDGGEFGGDDMGGEEQDIEDRVMDLETALDELKAEFEQLMSDEEGEHHDDMGGMDDMGDEMGAGDEMGDGDEMMESSEEDDEEEDEEDVAESRRYKSEAERLREYVDKVSDGHGAEKAGAGEGSVVGKEQSSKPSVNTKHIVAGKNDMGGTAANIVKGGSEQSPEGTSPKGKAGGFLKPAQEIDVAKRNVNKVGGNKGAQNYYSNKETSYEKAKGKEGQTTDGSLSVDKNSILKRIS